MIRSLLKRALLRLVANDLRIENSNLRRELMRVSEFALVDALTGLLNRRALNNSLAEIGQQAAEHEAHRHQRRNRRTPETFGFLSVDLCGFKRINDAFGHAVGDEALVAVAEALRASVRATDRLIFRPGGDEFVVLLDDVNAEEAKTVARRIVQKIEGIEPWSLSARVGGAIWNIGRHPAARPEDVLGFADLLQVNLRNEHRRGETDIQDYEP